MDAQGRVTAHEVRLAMRAVYRQDREVNIQKALLHALRDDLRPLTPQGRWKPHPLLVTAAVVLAAAVTVFLYFKMGKPA